MIRMNIYKKRDNFFFLNDTTTTEIYILSLHDALPISIARGPARGARRRRARARRARRRGDRDRKSTRLNSSHVKISYAVFCLKKKKKTKQTYHTKKKKNHNIT